VYPALSEHKYLRQNLILSSDFKLGFPSDDQTGRLYCTMFCVFNPTMTPNVRCWGTWPLYITGLRYLSLLNTNYNVLGYWRHRSICYISLFTTPLVVTTISVYSVLWPSDVVSRSGSLISSVICSVIYFGDLSLVSLSRCLFYLCLSYLLPLKSSVCAWNRRHFPPRLHFPLLRFSNNLVA
jgi:hypothetical protein